MAKATKKPLVTTPMSNVSRLIAQMKEANGDSSITTVSAAMNSWRYLDFLNPQAKLPCLTLEWLFGARGLLAGRIMQLRATFSKGKSSFMYLQYAAAQALSAGFCLHIETEGAGSPADYVASFGCNPHELMMQEIESLEECMAKVDEIICRIRGGFDGTISAEGRELKTKFTDPIDPGKASPILIGIDSLSSLGTEAGVGLDIADATKTGQISFHTNKLREYFRNRVGRFRDTQALLMITSHETAKIETGFKKSFGGPQKTSLAQEAIGIHGTYGIDLDLKAWNDENRGRIGDIVSIKTFKNKISPRGRGIELFLAWNQGFDLIKTDANFLLNHPASPFTKEQLYRHGRGITCKPLGEKPYPNEEELIRALYDNKDLLASIRETMRIRGFGFDFERRYQDLPDAEEPDDGVAGSTPAVP